MTGYAIDWLQVYITFVLPVLIGGAVWWIAYLMIRTATDPNKPEYLTRHNGKGARDNVRKY